MIVFLIILKKIHILTRSSKNFNDLIPPSWGLKDNLFSIRLQIVNSIVMNHVTIGDGCSIQGSVVCSNVQLLERVVLKDCQVTSPCLLFSLLSACVCGCVECLS